MKLDRVKVGQLTLWPVVEDDGKHIHEAMMQTIKELEHLKSAAPDVYDAHHFDTCLMGLRHSILYLNTYYTEATQGTP